MWRLCGLHADKKAKIANPMLRAVDGIEALEMLKGTNGKEKAPSPILLLVDLNMPRMGGREVLTQGNFWKRDEHWNASGHKKIGEQLGNFLNGLID